MFVNVRGNGIGQRVESGLVIRGYRGLDGHFVFEAFHILHGGQFFFDEGCRL